MFAELVSRDENGEELDVLVWRPPHAMLAASTAASGGGIGPRHWVLNAEVRSDYARVDLGHHVDEIVGALGLQGTGVAMLTAAPVCFRRQSSEGGVDVEVTVGLSHPQWAVSDDDVSLSVLSPGTINIVVFVPVRLEEGALLNVIATATEAKSQALWEASINATGTPSDAVAVLCPLEGDVERFGGPRSRWGAHVARGVRDAVRAGARVPTR